MSHLLAKKHLPGMTDIPTFGTDPSSKVTIQEEMANFIIDNNLNIASSIGQCFDGWKSEGNWARSDKVRCYDQKEFNAILHKYFASNAQVRKASDLQKMFSDAVDESDSDSGSDSDSDGDNDDGSKGSSGINSAPMEVVQEPKPIALKNLFDAAGKRKRCDSSHFGNLAKRLKTFSGWADPSQSSPPSQVDALLFSESAMDVSSGS